MGVVGEDAVPMHGLSSDLTRPDVFKAFYRASLPAVYGYFFNRCGDSTHDAEDLTQETFMAAVSELMKGTRPTSPQAWILGIAKHKLLDHFRREQRSERNFGALFKAGRTADPPTWMDASQDRAWDALALVPPAQRQALVLRYFDGLSVEEVADALGRSVHATESLLARGRDSFRRSYAAFEVGTR